MWTCPDCGCQGIAASLTTCPQCFKERDHMPTVTSGGASNANALPGETGYVDPEAEAVAETAPEVPADAEVPDTAEPAEAVSEPQDDPKPAPAKVAAKTTADLPKAS